MDKMKPIIVTYSNESWMANSGKITMATMSYHYMVLPRGGLYFCENIISRESKAIWLDDIKLIARPKQKLHVS
jgi:hypothetical protein